MNKFNAYISRFRRPLAFLILVFFILLPIGIYLYIQNKWIVEPLPLGTKIPSIMVTTMDGSDTNIISLIIKKTVIVFFSTTCPHCKSELQYLNSFYHKFKNEFEIIALSLNTQKETKQFVADLNISFSIYLDITNDAKHQFRVMPVPALFFINQQKQIIHYQAGEQRKELLHSTLLRFAAMPFDSLYGSL